MPRADLTVQYFLLFRLLTHLPQLVYLRTSCGQVFIFIKEGVMAKGSRKEVVKPDEIGVYHVWARCVRQAFLCGFDKYSGKDYEYRRDWICAFEEVLAGLFAIEVGFHAELVNHLHLVIRNRPDVVEQWSDDEVVHRWLQITHVVKSQDGKLQEVSEERIAEEFAKPKRIPVLRRRLADPSWFMAILDEYVARRSNREDGTSGHFWEERFDARRLENEASILICGIYVDLNQIRAGEATTPETSVHTSAYDRIVTRQAAAMGQEVAAEERRDGWLCELTLDEGLARDLQSNVRSATGRRASDKGLLSIRLDDYLQLLDFTGRQLRTDNKGTIPADLDPILKRLEINTEQWSDAVRHFHTWFGSVVGASAQVAQRAAESGRSWYRGQPRCAAVFG